MKRTKKFVGIISSFLLMIVGLVTATVSAATGGDATGGIALGIIFIFLGCVFIASIFIKVKGIPKYNPFLLGIGAAIMFVVAACSLGYAVLPNPFETTETDDDTLLLATWDVTPSGSATGIMTAEKDGFRVPAYANQTAYTVIQVDNSTTWADPVFTFACDPVMFDGADLDDMAQIVVEITNPDLTIDTSIDDYYLITKTGGNRQWVINIDGKIKYVSGNAQTAMTGNASIIITPDINQGSFAHMEDIYSSVTAYIKFANSATNPTWTETYKVEFMLTNVWT